MRFVAESEYADEHALRCDRCERCRSDSGIGQGHDLRYVLAPEAGVNVADKDGRTATMWAAVAGHLTCLQLLVDKGAEVSAKRKEGR